ncbi:MAG: pilus assembly protein PilM [Myxococcales bacterium]|jgi:general secretion pathway protein L|nr:pilus assembly protein PilM [Myxococcales bacterium]
MARILGLDLGAHSIKAILLESSFRGAAIVSHTQLEREADGGFDFSRLVSHLRLSKSLHVDQIIVAAPGASVATQHLSLPFTDTRRIEATLGFEIESLLPYDIDEVTYDHQVLTTEGGKSELIVGTARTAEIASLLAELKAAGLDPRVVTSSALAYQNLICASPVAGVAPGLVAGQEGLREAILDIGHERSSLCVGAPSGKLECARTFQGGGRDLTRALAMEFEVSLDDAQAWKEQEANLSDDLPPHSELARARGALRQALMPILREVRATLRANDARFHSSVGRLFLAGGTANLRGLCAFFSQELGMEVLPLSLGNRGAEARIEAPDQVIYGQAYALSLQGQGTLRGHRFNLRKGALSFKGDLDYLKGKASRLGVFALALLLLAGVSMVAQWRNVSQREQAIDAELFEMTKRVLGQGQKNYDIALNLLRGSGSPQAQLPAVSALDLFTELTDSAQKMEVKLEEVDAQLERIKVRGETAGFDGVDRLVSALEAVACFKEVKRNRVQKNKDGSKVVFDLDIRVSCSAGPASSS